MKRIAVISICASALLALLTGCASEFQRESEELLDATLNLEEEIVAQKIEEMANKMLQEGYELVTMSITGTAKAILVFRMQ